MANVPAYHFPTGGTQKKFSSKTEQRMGEFLPLLLGRMSQDPEVAGDNGYLPSLEDASRQFEFEIIAEH